MHNPRFDVKVLGRFQIQDDPDTYEEKAVYYYEFEFYTEDYAGGTWTDGVFRPARKGGFCIFRPGQLQRLVPLYRCYVMNLAVYDPQLKEQLDRMPTFSMLFHMDEVIRLLHQMLAIEDRSALDSSLRLHGYAAQILALLLQNHRISEQMDLNTLRHQQALLAADQYLREHLSENISLGQLARQSNLDPTYFHKLFTAAFGATPARQLLNYRISAVKTGLLEENVSLEALAQRCGFSSASYLGNRFRQATGQTPTQYRKSIQHKK